MPYDTTLPLGSWNNPYPSAAGLPAGGYVTPVSPEFPAGVIPASDVLIAGNGVRDDLWKRVIPGRGAVYIIAKAVTNNAAPITQATRDAAAAVGITLPTGAPLAGPIAAAVPVRVVTAPAIPAAPQTPAQAGLSAAAVQAITVNAIETERTANPGRWQSLDISQRQKLIAADVLQSNNLIVDPASILYTAENFDGSVFHGDTVIPAPAVLIPADAPGGNGGGSAPIAGNRGVQNDALDGILHTGLGGTSRYDPAVSMTVTNGHGLRTIQKRPTPALPAGRDPLKKFPWLPLSLAAGALLLIVVFGKKLHP